MTDATWRVLVPVQVLEGETIPDSVLGMLSTLPVVVLGYHVLPEQTPPGQARLQFEDQAQAKLGDLVAAVREAGGEAETRLVFTHDEEQTIDRVADETGCDAVLIPNPMGEAERLLVPVGGQTDVERIAAFVAALLGGRDIALTVYHVADSDEGIDGGRDTAENAAARLREAGIPADAISTEVTVSDTRVEAISAAAVDHDAVVMGESEQSLRSFLLGEDAERVAAESIGPVVVVRRVRDAPADGRGTTEPDPDEPDEPE